MQRRRPFLDRQKTICMVIVAASVIGGRLVAQQAGQPAGDAAPAAAPPPVVRTDLSGDWTYTNAEDQPHRIPGPTLGDYTGLPLNDADRQKADAWDATILSQPERQAQPHPAQYLMRGPGPGLRIMKVLDPVTQELLAYAVAGGFGRADRVIWMDGRPHPSDFSEHTWDGFSTGVWENGQLVVTTTHMKMGVVQRNGAAVSPYSKMVEHFFRHGDLLMMFSLVDDPVYFEEPMARSQTWRWNPNGNTALGNAFESVDELGDKPLGWVPFYPLGVTHPDLTKAAGVPFPATRGGKESLYPEYQLKLQQVIKEDAARQAAEAAKPSQDNAAPKK